MNIRTMTANFGGLENKTLALQPGLNVVVLPNGGGKTTWCAFFEAMLYGVEDGSFAPWDGRPMSGKIELVRQGRAITLERNFTAGTFRAWQTDTGTALPELTAENCGRQLLGLDRAGYLRLFGKEEGAQVLNTRRLLEQGLTEGQAQCCRELEEARAALKFWEKSAQDRQELEKNLTKLEARRLEAENFRLRLERHLDALAHSPGARQAQQARQAYEQSLREQERLEAFTKTLPTRQEARQRQNDLQSLDAAWTAVQKARENLESEPQRPVCPEAFQGLDLRQVQQKAQEDTAAYGDSVGSISLILLLLGLLGLLLGCIGAFPLQMPALGIAVMGLGVLALAGAVLFCGRGKNRLAALGKEYGTQDWRRWPEIAQGYIRACIAYEENHTRWVTRKEAIRQRMQELEQQRARLCEGGEPKQMEELCAQVLESWDALDRAKEQTQSAKARMDIPAEEEPGGELGLTKEEAETCLNKTGLDLQQLREDMDGIRATLASLETAGALDAKTRQAGDRVEMLSKYERAYALSMDALKNTTRKIENRGKQEAAALEREYFRAMTGTEFPPTLSGGTREAAVLAGYLARVRVYAKDAPLLLDDVLARLDDQRMQKALAVLKGENRQIILFTGRRQEAEAAQQAVPTPAAGQGCLRPAPALPNP